MIRKAVLEGKVGHLCHFVMTGCVSPLGTLPHSSGETDTDTGKGTVTSLTRLLGLQCVCVCVCISLNITCPFPFLHLCVMHCWSSCVCVQMYVCSCLLAVTQCNRAGLSWSHTDSCELSLRTHRAPGCILLTSHTMPPYACLCVPFFLMAL